MIYENWRNLIKLCPNVTVLQALLAFKVLRTLILLKSFNSIQFFWSIKSLKNFISIKSLRSIFERSWTQCFWVFLLVHTLFSSMGKDSALLRRLITFFSRSFSFQNYDIIIHFTLIVIFRCLLNSRIWLFTFLFTWKRAGNLNLKLKFGIEFELSLR